MINKNKIISVIIIILILILSYSTTVNANDKTNSDAMITIWLPGISEDNYFRQLQVSEEDVEELMDKIDDTLNVINETMHPNSSGYSKITYEEWQKIGLNVYAFIDSIRLLFDDFPNIDISKLLSKIIQGFFIPLPGFFRPKPIFSAGLGTTWIPFYDYETFLGMMFRPMLTRYLAGYTQVGGFKQCRFTVGKYYIINSRFTGIFINLGDIGFEDIFGPTMYLGTVFTSRI